MAAGTEKLKAIIHNIVSFATVSSSELDPWMERLVIESEMSVDSYIDDMKISEVLRHNQAEKKSRVMALEQELKDIQPKIEHALKMYEKLTKDLHSWLSARGINHPVD